MHTGLGKKAGYPNELRAAFLVGWSVHRNERGQRIASPDSEITPEARVVGGRGDAELVPEGRAQPPSQLLNAVQNSS